MSVKFTPAGRVHRFLMPELGPGERPGLGDAVIVATADGPAVAHVVRQSRPTGSEVMRPLPIPSVSTVRTYGEPS